MYSSESQSSLSTETSTDSNDQYSECDINEQLTKQFVDDNHVAYKCLKRILTSVKRNKKPSESDLKKIVKRGENR